MKRSDAISLCLDHVGLDPSPSVREDVKLQFMQDLITDACHNVAICAKCEETFDIEPDAQNGPCPNCDGGKYYTLTFLFGVPI